MPEIKPFRAVRFDAGAFDMSHIICLPYDVISPDLQNELYRRHSFNAVRLELPKEENGYVLAAQRFRQWQEQGILLREHSPSLYVYEQTYRGIDGNDKTRSGFFCALALEEFSRGNILPHERTLSAPKEDRLKILRAVQANLSPVFGIYSGAKPMLAEHLRLYSGASLVDIYNERNERNVLFVCNNSDLVQTTCAQLSGAKIYIADGHHRYETALAYRDEMRREHPDAPPDAPWNYILTFLCDMNCEALEIQPTHRLLHSLPGFTRTHFEENLAQIFQLQSYHSIEEGHAALGSAGSESILFVYPDTTEVMLATLRNGQDVDALFGADVPQVLRSVSVEILHTLVLRNMLGMSDEMLRKKTNIEYVHTVTEVQESLFGGHFQAAAVLKPTTMEQLRQTADSGVVLPQKSTYFYPKLLSGLVFRDLAN